MTQQAQSLEDILANDSAINSQGRWLQKAHRAFLSLSQTETNNQQDHSVESTLALLKEAYKIINHSKDKISAQAEHIQKLEKISFIDELTTLLNKEGFVNELQRELDRINRGHANDGLLVLIELDNHHSIKANHGQDAADAALKIIGVTLSNDSRTMDILGRIKEDEFASLLINTDRDKAVERAHFLIKKLNNLSFIWQKEEIAICTSLAIKNFKKGCKIQHLFTNDVTDKNFKDIFG